MKEAMMCEPMKCTVAPTTRVANHVPGRRGDSKRGQNRDREGCEG